MSAVIRNRNKGTANGGFILTGVDSCILFFFAGGWTFYAGASFLHCLTSVAWYSHPFVPPLFAASHNPGEPAAAAHHFPNNPAFQ